MLFDVGFSQGTVAVINQILTAFVKLLVVSLGLSFVNEIP